MFIKISDLKLNQVSVKYFIFLEDNSWLNFQVK